jgi:uncharacterized protein (TIGR00369 family)
MSSDPDSDSSAERLRVRRQLTGLEYFQRMMDGTVTPPPMVQLLGMRMTELSPGRVVFAATPDERFYNGLGVAHGGWAATVLDSALGCAINSAMAAGRLFTTLELTINYNRPLRKEIGEVRCEATILHSGNRTATAEARIVDAAGKMYAHGTTICMLVERDSNA